MQIFVKGKTMAKNKRRSGYLQLWVDDLLGDIMALSPHSRGCWITFLCYAHKADPRGTVSMTLDSWCRLFGSGLDNTIRSIDEIRELQIGDVIIEDVENGRRYGSVTEGVTSCVTNNGLLQKNNAKVTVINRRMKRESKDKGSNALRQMRYREKCKSNSEVTDMSRSLPLPLPIPVSKPPPPPPSTSGEDLSKSLIEQSAVGGGGLDWFFSKYKSVGERGIDAADLKAIGKAHPGKASEILCAVVEACRDKRVKSPLSVIPARLERGDYNREIMTVVLAGLNPRKGEVCACGAGLRRYSTQATGNTGYFCDACRMNYRD